MFNFGSFNFPELRRVASTTFVLISFQYIHGIFTQLAFYSHQPTSLLRDRGFELLPELGAQNQWVSEMMFGISFSLFIIWLLVNWHIEAYVKWVRLLCICQLLRIITFSVTLLPSPNYHCRKENFIAPELPSNPFVYFVVNIGRQTTRSCGDLIFSSHTIFILSFAIIYSRYGIHNYMKLLAWLWACVTSILIIASRKHYTVDVIVAWYVVPLVNAFLYNIDMSALSTRTQKKHCKNRSVQFDKIDRLV